MAELCPKKIVELMVVKELFLYQFGSTLVVKIKERILYYLIVTTQMVCF